LAVIRVGKSMRALDLTAEGIGAKLSTATNGALIEDIFESDGINCP
jgi:hypothetical protein